MKKLIIIFVIFFSGFSNTFSQWTKVCDIYSGGVDAFADNGNIIYAAVTGDGLYKSTNNGNNWILLNPGLSHVNQWAVVAKDSNVFIGTDTGMFKSTNNGNNWTFSNRWAYSLAIVEEYNINYVIAGASRMYRSSDWGNNWLMVTEGLPNQYILPFSMTSNNNIVYSGITESTNNTGIYKSTNYGSTWIFISPYFFIYSKSLYAFNNLILSGGSDEVSISTNYGNNWRHIPGMSNSSYLFGFASKETKDVFISSWSRGFYTSNDSGQTWNLKNEGLGNLYSTALHRFGNYLYISLNPLYGNGGIYRRPLSEVIEVRNISTEIPGSSKLYQNYPNPFNPVTKINFDLPKNSKVNLMIYDLLGREIKSLVNEYKSAGSYTVEFNGSNLASGVYFYKIRAGDFVQVKRMVLVK